MKVRGFSATELLAEMTLTFPLSLAKREPNHTARQDSNPMSRRAKISPSESSGWKKH